MVVGLYGGDKSMSPRFPKSNIYLRDGVLRIKDLVALDTNEQLYNVKLSIASKTTSSSSAGRGSIGLDVTVPVSRERSTGRVLKKKKDTERQG